MLKLAVASVAVPYLVGYLVSSRIISVDYFHRSGEAHIEQEIATKTGKKGCHPSLSDILLGKDGNAQDPFDSVRFVVHRNGEAEPCGKAPDGTGVVSAMELALQSFDYCPHEFDSYAFESFLTSAFAGQLLPSGSCASQDDDEAQDSLLGFCDMGHDRTPILLDHDHLVRVPSKSGEPSSLPCHFHTREGVRINSLEQLADLSRKAKAANTCPNEDVEDCSESNAELHFYAVPAGRVFMFAPTYVGEIFELPHVQVPSGLLVYLEVLSVRPRIFDIFNFFSKDESNDLIERALAETRPSHRIKRSTTGASSNSIFSKRTSESGFDTHGETAQKVKRRCMKVLGYDEYLEGHTDGLQILRYNLTKAYVPHMDYLDDATAEHDFDSAGKGGNRYATILLYMNDLGEHDGGETVFPHAWPIGQAEEDRVELPEALKELRESEDVSALEEGSWEEEMVAKCRTRLAIRPNSARAVLFYSQHPNGEEDKSSLHGGCPVLAQEKYAANLWVWNTPRPGFDGSPVREDIVESNRKDHANNPSEYIQLTADFVNTGTDPAFAEAELYYDESSYWGPLGHSDPPLQVNTYEGHKWNIKVNGKIVRSWVIGKEAKQVFKI